MATGRITDESDNDDDNDTRLRLRTKQNRQRSMARMAGNRVKDVPRSYRKRAYWEAHPEARIKISISMRKYWSDPQWRARMLEIFSSPEFRKRQSRLVKGAYKRKKELR